MYGWKIMQAYCVLPDCFSIQHAPPVASIFSIYNASPVSTN